MSDATMKQVPGAEPAPQVDQVQLRFALEQLRSQQNLVGGALAGLAASAVGAAAWAGITVATGYQIGWMAIGVGFLVGLAVRMAGKGIDSVFGVVGGALALLGCAAGNLLAVCGIVAGQEGMAFADVLAGLDPTVARELMVASFSPMDVLFYALAVYEGYKLSFRQISQQELGSLSPGR
jgi:hypothetical protein